MTTSESEAMSRSVLVVARPTTVIFAARTAFNPLKLSSKPIHSDGATEKHPAPFR